MRAAVLAVVDPCPARRVEHGNEVGLVGAAAVQQHERSLGRVRALANEVCERLGAHLRAREQIGETPTVSLFMQPECSIVGSMATMSSLGESHLLSPLELRAWRGMLRVHAVLAKALDAQLEEAHGLQLSSYEVLMYLADAEHERMRMCDLASSILLSRSGLTRLVDRLAREGLIERVACDADARGQFAKLTPAGREKLAAARVTHLAGVRALFLERFSPEELELLGGAWDRVIDGAGHSCCKT